ncbi:MAG: hypothetical protein GXC76_07135 [Rhodanobacteraceae bacterium]|jgi:photosystem II stability/assembly factor-like uncharacterized protein|nr:hypothetical protein [Rhodanobacteraceae bacterium]
MIARRLLVFAAVLVAASAAADSTPSDAQFGGLQWRQLGPFRGGWATMATGIAEQPDTFYFGAAGGGVWKSDDAGATWQPMSEGLGAASIGAIAVAPSNPQVLYAGTGQPEPRYDIAAGNGVYRSDDGGAHWRPLGLEATRHIGALLVDPKNPDTVLVGALGHIFGPNRERGVFRTTDGGKHWTQTLFVDEQTGVVDLAADPAQPNLVFAAAWTARNWPWLSYFTPISGAGSAIHASRDGGVTWQRLGGEGWPTGALGRIGLAVTHLKNGATRIYASIDAGAQGGLYRSDDGGMHWERVNDAKAVASWYMSRLTVAPDDPDTVYTVGQSIHKSTDAGQTFTILKGAPGGDDYHHLWINPKQPARMVTASDQGTVVSVDGGAHWSDWYNQPTGQFYHLATDDRFPYWIYSGQQDSGTVRIASRSDYGALSYRDWHPVGGDERDYDLPDPADPDIVYGSGLGGRISRWDARTGTVQNVSPWPVSSYGARPTDVKYRSTWISPIAFARQAPHALYAGAQVLFRSTDQGRSWDTISPDLTGQRDVAEHCDGDVAIEHATACGYGVIFSIAPSPHGNDEIWIGTDNGRVQLTRDGGKSWRDVTPKQVPDWAKIATLDVSALEPGTAYIAVDNHRQDDFRPRILRTRDYGASWSEIANGLPDGHFVGVVRADPVRRGLLYAGTDAGVFVSLDDGAHWQSLQRNLPVAWVRDLLVHGNDLIAATQGRAIWVLDDVSPLRQLDASVAKARAHLFAPAPAYRVRANQNKDTPLPADTALGTNPPAGAIIDYTLAQPARRVTLDIRDGEGRLVRRFDSAAPTQEPAAARYFAAGWLRPAGPLATAAGAHRFVWDLRLPRPKAVAYNWSIAATWGRDTPLTPEGPLALPGDYQLVLAVDGRELRQPLRVLADPRVSTPPAELAQALAFSQAIDVELARVWQGHGEVAAVQQQLDALTRRGGAAAQVPLKDALTAFAAKLEPLHAGEGETAPNLGAIGEVLASLATDIDGADRAPTAPQQQVLADYRARLDRAIATWQTLREQDLAALDAQLQQAGLTPIRVPTPDEIGLGGGEESRDVP